MFKSSWMQFFGKFWKVLAYTKHPLAQMCIVVELDGLAWKCVFHNFQRFLAKKLCTFWHHHHKQGRLAYDKSFQNLQKYCIYLILDMSYAKSSKGLKKWRKSATVPNIIWFFLLFLVWAYSLDQGASLGTPGMVLSQPVASQKDCPSSNAIYASLDSTVMQIMCKLNRGIQNLANLVYQ